MGGQNISEIMPEDSLFDEWFNLGKPDSNPLCTSVLSQPTNSFPIITNETSTTNFFKTSEADYEDVLMNFPFEEYANSSCETSSVFIWIAYSTIINQSY